MKTCGSSKTKERNFEEISSRRRITNFYSLHLSNFKGLCLSSIFPMQQIGNNYQWKMLVQLNAFVQYMRVLMGVPSYQLTTNFSANCQLTTNFS